jgi:hypothetical protein
MANISFNPALMTGAQNTFLLDTQGFIQGLTLDDWVSRAHLSSGLVASSVSQAVWGGMGVAVDVSGGEHGESVGLASTTQINGFTVYDQGINFIQIPGNNVPTVVAGQSVPFYKFGSKASIPVPCSAATASALLGGTISPTLYWDTAAFELTTTSSTTTIELPSTVTVRRVNMANSKVITYNSTTGAASWSEGQPAAVIIL